MHSSATIDLLLHRRSCVASALRSPGPSELELETLLRCATRVPDHKALTPWRIQILDNANLQRFNEKLQELYTGPQDAAYQKFQLKRPETAPVCFIVSSHIRSDKAPRSEQLSSAAAVCQNTLVAATALGYGCQWITEWPAYHQGVKEFLGISPSDEILGFIFIGTQLARPPERVRPDIWDVAQKLKID